MLDDYSDFLFHCSGCSQRRNKRGSKYIGDTKLCQGCLAGRARLIADQWKDLVRVRGVRWDERKR